MRTTLIPHLTTLTTGKGTVLTAKSDATYCQSGSTNHRKAPPWVVPFFYRPPNYGLSCRLARRPVEGWHIYGLYIQRQVESDRQEGFALFRCLADDTKRLLPPAVVV